MFRCEDRRQTRRCLELKIPITAATGIPRSHGGKMEEGRYLLNLAKENNWKIPVRNLQTLEKVGEIFVTEATKNPEMPLFWLSLELLMQHFNEKEGIYKVYPFDAGGKRFTFEAYDAEIVHIQEPGKQRNLTKMTGVLYWALLPASQFSAEILARIPSHSQGLKGSSHAWKYERRLNPYSGESDFMYDPQSRVVKEGIYQSFQDWVQATDMIPKRIGLTLWKAFSDYIGFYDAYGTLVGRAISEPVYAKEAIFVGNAWGDHEVTPVKWEGWIQTGFPMGMIMTKIILHLLHIPEEVFASLFLKSKNIRLMPNVAVRKKTDFSRRSVKPLSEVLPEKSVTSY